MIEKEEESDRDYPLAKLRSIQGTTINQNLKHINEIQKKIALIESKGSEQAFFLPITTKPELKVYFEDLLQDLDGFKLPKEIPTGFHWKADQKRFHLQTKKQKTKVQAIEKEAIPNVASYDKNASNMMLTDDSYRQL